MSNKGDSATARLLILSGIFYSSIILLALLKMGLIDARFASGTMGETVRLISGNMLLYKIGILMDVLMYALVALLSTALFLLFRDSDRIVASFAFALRFAESVLGFVIVILGGVVPLAELARRNSSSEGLLTSIFDVLFGGASQSMFVLLMVMGAGGILFFFLFLKTDYVPKVMSIWGIITYAVMIIFPVLSILYPELDGNIAIIAYAPGSLFEFLFGIFLVRRGILIKKSLPT